MFLKPLVIVAASLLLLGVIACPALESETGAPRHLVLLTLDTLRSDRLGAYGYAHPTSPNLDELANAGVRFDDAISQAVSTAPSHASIMTGLNPPGHGLRSNWGQALAPANRTLAEILRDAGFVTAAFVSGAPLRPQIGLDQGFDHYETPPKWDPQKKGRLHRRAGETTRLAIRWLSGRPAGRLFLWVHYFDPHYPYFPPESFRKRFGATQPRPFPQPINTNDPSESQPRTAVVRSMSDLYDAEIRYMDAAIGRLLVALSKEGVLQDAVVAVVADHGEHLGEHGYFFGHYDVLEETAQVPMILMRPGAPWSGSVVSSPVAAIDLMPTVLGWLGVEAGVALDGRDLGPLIEGGAPIERSIYTEQLEYFPVRAIRSDERLLLVRGDSDFPTAPLASGLYQRRVATRYGLESNPDPERQASLEAELRSIDLGVRTAPVDIDVPDDVRDQLEALGYVEEP